MDQGLRDWLALALMLFVLGLLSAWFARRTYRLAVCAAIAAGVVAVTAYGLNLGGHPATYLDALRLGGNELASQMFGPAMPATLRGSVVPGGWGWLAMLVLTGGLLISFDTLSTRRQPPAVRVGDPPGPSPDGAGAAGPSGLAVRRFVTEELRFRLPAVEVRAPGSMPGGSTLESLATMVSGSGLQGSKATAAIMQAVHALEARPRVYEVNSFVQHCGPDGRPGADGGGYVLVTVDLRDARTGQSVATRVLRPCRLEDAAEMVAGFTARQVFRRDATTPDWAVGSLDGEDLSAYLLTREMRPAGRTYRELWECRQRQARLLTAAVRRSSSAGLVQYELASIRELDGRPLDALLLHLGNRLHHPRFLRARYRLAASLSMLADPVSFSHWLNAGQPADGADPEWAAAGVKAEIIRQLRQTGLLRLPVRDFRRLGVTGPGLFPSGVARLSPRQRRAAAGARERAAGDALAAAGGEPGQRERARQVLLLLARRELAACRRRLRASTLLWWALAHRAERAAALSTLRRPPHWWRHPRRRLWAVAAGQEIASVRLCQLEHPDRAAARLAAAQARVRRRLGLSRILDDGRPWAYGRVPWQAVYNAACLYALPAPGTGVADRDSRDAVALLRLAISDPACELDRPTEWLSADPDLRPLRSHPQFRELVREQAARDFTAAPDNDVAGPWLRALLPVATATPEVDACPPVRVRWLRPSGSRRPQRT